MDDMNEHEIVVMCLEENGTLRYKCNKIHIRM